MRTLGILFMITMRQVYIVKNEDNLQYPEGLACASVLEAGQDDAESDSATSIIKGALVGGAFKGLISFAGILKGNLETAMLSGSRIFFFGSDIDLNLLDHTLCRIITGFNVSGLSLTIGFQLIELTLVRTDDLHNFDTNWRRIDFYVLGDSGQFTKKCFCDLAIRRDDDFAVLAIDLSLIHI